MKTTYTYTYSYKMELPRFIPRVGNVLTGRVRVGRECSADEVEALAKEMLHGKFDDAKLVEVRLINETNETLGACISSERRRNANGQTV